MYLYVQMLYLYIYKCMHILKCWYSLYINKWENSNPHKFFSDSHFLTTRHVRSYITEMPKQHREINHCKWGSNIKVVVAHFKRTRQAGYWSYGLKWYTGSGYWLIKKKRGWRETGWERIKWGGCREREKKKQDRRKEALTTREYNQTFNWIEGRVRTWQILSRLEFLFSKELSASFNTVQIWVK